MQVSPSGLKTECPDFSSFNSLKHPAVRFETAVVLAADVTNHRRTIGGVIAEDVGLAIGAGLMPKQEGQIARTARLTLPRASATTSSARSSSSRSGSEILLRRCTQYPRLMGETL